MSDECCVHVPLTSSRKILISYCLEFLYGRYLHEDLEQGKLGLGGDDHNNGLRFTVMVLESIYTNPAFPARTPQLATSLKESGKSRADLWAFATMVAVDFAIETNNLVCTDPEHPSTAPFPAHAHG